MYSKSFIIHAPNTPNVSARSCKCSRAFAFFRLFSDFFSDFFIHIIGRISSTPPAAYHPRHRPPAHPHHQESEAPRMHWMAHWMAVAYPRRFGNARSRAARSSSVAHAAADFTRRSILLSASCIMCFPSAAANSLQDECTSWYRSHSHAASSNGNV